MKKCIICGKDFPEEDLVEVRIVEDETSKLIESTYICKDCYEPISKYSEEEISESFKNFIKDLEQWEKGTKENATVGKIIKIMSLKDEDESYKFKTGAITHIDDIGQLHGTWGGLAIIPDVDSFLVLKI